MLSNDDPLLDQLMGRALFCEDRGEVKTPELLRRAAEEIGSLRGLLAAYVRDEMRFNRGEGEPYGSITTETGMRARAAIGK